MLSNILGSRYRDVIVITDPIAIADNARFLVLFGRMRKVRQILAIVSSSISITGTICVACTPNNLYTIETRRTWVHLPLRVV
jgi:hypothetical protein